MCKTPNVKSGVAQNGRTLPVVWLGVAFLSGAVDLVYELLWSRILMLVLGATVAVHALLLATMMLGLALGGFLADKSTKWRTHAGPIYATLEVSVGVYALLSPLLLADGVMLWTRAVGSGVLGAPVLRLVVAALLLLPPCVLMGATMPVLSLGVARGEAARLYAYNLLGGAAAALVAGFVLLPSLGVQATLQLASGCSVGLGLLAWQWGRQRKWRLAMHQRVAEVVLGGEQRQGTAGQRWEAPWLWMTLFVSGFNAMVVQVLLNRMLALILGSSFYAFADILGVFLAGTGFGALRQVGQGGLPWLATVYSATACALVVAQWCLAEVSVGQLQALSASWQWPAAYAFLLQLGTVVLVLCPVMMGFGQLFAAGIERLRVQRTERVGAAYGVNCCGALAGILVASFVLIPELGVRLSLLATAVLLGLVGVVLVYACSRRAWAGRGAGSAGPLDPWLPAALALGVTALGLVWWVPDWNYQLLSSGAFRGSLAGRKSVAQGELLFYQDGMAATISVHRGTGHHWLKSNGKVEASSARDVPTQVAVGLLPLLLHQGQPERALLIGLGSGITAGSMLRFPLQRLDVVEIEPAVVQASHYFDTMNHRPLNDARVRLTLDDGRGFLRTHARQFDVVVSEPSNPWITGVANLFTVEFFREAKQRLVPGGVVCQWIQLYELTDQDVRTLYRTVQSEFAHVLVFAPAWRSWDTLILASDAPLNLDLDRLQARLEQPNLSTEAKRVGWNSAESVAASLLLQGNEVARFAAGAPLNTDDNARVEFAAPWTMLAGRNARVSFEALYGRTGRYGNLQQALRSDTLPCARRLRLAQNLLARCRGARALPWLTPETCGAAHGAALWLAQAQHTPLARPSDHPLFRLEKPQLLPIAPGRGNQRLSAAELEAVALSVMDGQFALADKVVGSWPLDYWQGGGQDALLLFAVMMLRAGNVADSHVLLRSLVQEQAFLARRPEALYYLARAEAALGQCGHAQTLLRNLASDMLTGLARR